MNNDNHSIAIRGSVATDLRRTELSTFVQDEPEEDISTLTKAELTELLFEHVGLNKREAKDMVEAFFEEIAIALERGEAVKLTGFGNFQLRDKASCPGRNLRTGKTVTIAPRRVVTFQPSLKLRGITVDSTIIEHID